MSLEVLTSDLLEGTRHGFFTRRGGASSGVYAGLNCGPGSSDQAEAVGINRARVAEAMGIAREKLLSLYQVHSADVVVAGQEGWRERPRADAAVTDQPGIALSVLTADCAPVLFHDPEAGVIGAAHAGWRGALEGVIEATLEAMEGLGAEAGRVRAAVGPTISQRAYEVGPEFFEAFMAEDPAHGRFFVGGREDRFQFDLPGFVLWRLRRAGVGDAVWIGECTYSVPERYFSYRRKTQKGEADYGRLISAIALYPNAQSAA
jgi:YfiH family protein